MALCFSYDALQKSACYAMATIINVNRKIMDIDGSRQNPIKNVADDLSGGFSKNRTGAGDLQLLAKKTSTPRERV